MNGRALILLGMAAVCGLAAMFGVHKFLNSRPPNEVPMSEVLVASQEIRVEQSIAPEMVATKEMPADMVPPGALTDMKQAIGRWAMIRILPGDVILDGKLAQKGTPTGMIARITPGMRAFAVRVDEQSGVSGFILPDYHVDVLQPRPDQPGRADIVLENVRVLASGTTFESPEERAIESTTVTLEVTPEQVRTLASAMQRGSLTLSLRGLNDDTLAVAEPPPEPVAEPTEPIPPPAPDPVSPPQMTTAEGPEAEPPRRLTFFVGRSSPRMHQVGPKEKTPSAPPEVAEAIEARRPFRLDGLGDISLEAPASLPPG